MGSRQKKEKKPKERKPSLLRRWWGRQDEAHKRSVLTACIWAVVAAAAVFGVVYGLKHLERYVMGQRTLQAGQQVRVVLRDAPPWMPERVKDRIRQGLTPTALRYNSPTLTDELWRQAENEPWVREVYRVVKYKASDGVTGIVEIQASYRRPAACVNCGNQLVFLDSDGVVLPSWEVPQCVAFVPSTGGGPATRACYISRREVPPSAEVRDIHYVVIQGVSAQPPALGKNWPGADLADALRLVDLLWDRPYSNQISSIDVSNYAHRRDRRETEIKLLAVMGSGPPTEIYWGRFEQPGGDYVTRTETKLAYLDQFVAHNGQLTGPKYIDLRYDEVRYRTQ